MELPPQVVSLVMDSSMDADTSLHFVSDINRSPDRYRSEVIRWLKESEVATFSAPQTPTPSISEEDMTVFHDFFPPNYAPPQTNYVPQPSPPVPMWNENYLPVPMMLSPSYYHIPPMLKQATPPKRTSKPLANRTNKSTAGQLHRNSICSNCQTRETPLWRWNSEGELECNACNVYQVRNNRKRPISYRKDKILRRKRCPRHKIN